jgi:hypothetical protein
MAQVCRQMNPGLLGADWIPSHDVAAEENGHQSRIPAEARTLLVAQWAQYLAEQRLGTKQVGSGSSGSIQTYTFGSPVESHFVLAYQPANDTWLIQSVSGFAESDVSCLLDDALDHANALDTGPDVVYRLTLSTLEPNLLSGAFGLHFMRLLGDQVRIAGRRRLSDRVILEFTEELVEAGKPLLFAPRTEIVATVFVPGPVSGPLAQRTASGVVEAVAAICTLALGRVVSGLPPALFPLPAEEAGDAQRLRTDPSILGLARDGVSLDIFGDLPSRAGGDAMLRARGTLLSYQAALEQRNPDVAVMLLVTSLEALIAPRPAWGKEKVTKRFIHALDELCPDVIDSLVTHPNVEQAFQVRLRGNPRRRRRQLLDRIYTMRSNPTHAGVGPSASGALFQLADPGGMRVALLSDLVRVALLAYLVAPRSWLIGHPVIDPAQGAGQDPNAK